MQWVASSGNKKYALCLSTKENGSICLVAGRGRERLRQSSYLLTKSCHFPHVFAFFSFLMYSIHLFCVPARPYKGSKDDIAKRPHRLWLTSLYLQMRLTYEKNIRWGKDGEIWHTGKSLELTPHKYPFLAGSTAVYWQCQAKSDLWILFVSFNAHLSFYLYKINNTKCNSVVVFLDFASHWSVIWKMLLWMGKNVDVAYCPWQTHLSCKIRFHFE